MAEPQARVAQLGGARGSRSARISSAATKLFFVLIFLQVPLFRVQCKTGVCQSPMELTAVQLASSKAAPLQVVKAMLYSGACFRQLVTTTTVPSWNKLLEMYNLTNVEAPASSDVLRLEILAGSYFAVAGAVIGVFKPGRMSMFGMLLISWGLLKEGLISKGSNRTVEATPALVFAVLLGFLSVKYDFQKVQRLTRPVVKPLRSSSKAKLK